LNRVLFVDDEPHVLQGLRRLLHMHRGRMRTEFAVGGAEALAIVGDAAAGDDPFTVVVTDMQMPGIDGAELLTRLQAEHPATIRIALSGHSSRATAVRAISHAHRFLGKPCDPDELVGTLDHAFALQHRFPHHELRTAVGRIDVLPSRPSSLRRLIALSGRAETTIEELTEAVTSDTALTAKVLQLAGSGFFAQAERAPSVADAVARLGVKVVCTLTSIEGPPVFAEAGSDDELPVPTGDLVDDVGQLVLAVLGASSQLAGTTLPPHELLGEYLLALWGLPGCDVTPLRSDTAAG
jgi:DNA-binding NarL/FixJ family response regulator